MSNAKIYNIDPIKFNLDPYPDLKAMRRNQPISFVPELGATLMTLRDDIFINENLSKIIQNYIIEKRLATRLFHLSSINVLIKERKDKYTLSKINSEKNLNTKYTSIIRLPLIINYNLGKKGDIEIFYKYINSKFLPFFPMIYPGNIFRPIEIKKVCNFSYEKFATFVLFPF